MPFRGHEIVKIHYYIKLIHKNNMQNVQEKSVKIGFLIKYKNGCYKRNYQTVYLTVITYKMNKCECSNSIRPAKVFKFGENIDSLNSLYMDFYIMP